MSDTERIREANEQRYNVVNGHQWREKKSTVVGQYGGKRVTEWECQGCGEVSSSRNAGECTSPTLWVRLGCSRDGVGVCEDCETVFLFDYGEQPFYEHGCPKCGSIEWYRDDDADADLEEVVGVPKTDGGSVEGGNDHWKDQDGCQDCGRSDVPLRAIRMVNSPRQMLCQDCFETALEVGEVDPTDPRLDGGGRYA